VMAWGHDPALEKHYVPARSQRSRSVLTFFAQDTGTHNLVYANADLTKATQNREVIAFCDYWNQSQEPRLPALFSSAIAGRLPGRPAEETRRTRRTWAFGCPRQVAAPAAAAALACSHLSLVSWPGGGSSSLIQARVAAVTCVPVTATPAVATTAPIPVRIPPMTSGPDLTWGQPSR
jgi:hypothetical protein